MAVLLGLGWNPQARAQSLQVNADIQLQSDTTLTSNVQVAADPGQTVVVELFATGIDNSVGLTATLGLNHPDVVSSIAGQSMYSRTGAIHAYNFPPDDKTVTWSAGDSTFKFDEGTIQAFKVGTHMAFVGLLNITMSQSFTTLKITLKSIKVTYFTGPAQTVTPNLVLTVVNPASIPRTLSFDLDPDSTNAHQLIGRYNPGEQVAVQVFGSGLQKLSAYELHAKVDTTAFDIRNTQFVARAPFTVTPPAGGVAQLPTATSSSSQQAGADVQLANTNGHGGDGVYNSGNIEITASPGDSVAIEIYATGFSNASTITARFWTDNLAAIKSVRAEPSSTFPLTLPGSTYLKSDNAGDRAVLNLAVLGRANASGTTPQLVGTLVLRLSSQFNGVNLNLRKVRFQGDTIDSIATDENINILPVGGIQASSVTVSGDSVIAQATTQDSVKGTDVRLGRFVFLARPNFQGGKITLTNATLTPKGGDTIPLQPNVTLDLQSYITDAPVVTVPPVPTSVTDKQVVIQWTTNKPGTSLVLYGTSASELDLQEGTNDLVTTHRVTLTGLTPGTLYYYQVASTDNQGNQSTAYPDNPSTFLTHRHADTTPPNIVEGPGAQGITTTGAEIDFSTDEAATVEVLYGTSETSLPDSASVTTPDRNFQVHLQNLTLGTPYYYKVKATDLSGNSATTPKALSFTTLSAADTQPLHILGRPVISGLGLNNAVVEWSTDKNSNSTVFYGTVANNLSDSSTVDESVRTHRIPLNNLLADTLYSYAVRSVDASGNSKLSSTFNFRTLAVVDSIAPRIVRPPVVPWTGNTQAVIQWGTDKPATSVVQYDTTTAIYTDPSAGEITSVSDATRQHKVTLTNLTPGKLYYFQVSSTDLAGNGPTTSSGQITFTTHSVARTTPPVVFSRPVAVGITTNSAIITWGADEPHSAVVRYWQWDYISDPSTPPSNAQVVQDIQLTRTHNVTLSNLVSGVPYMYQVVVTDPDGNSATFLPKVDFGKYYITQNGFWTLRTGTSSVPHIIVSPVARNITPTSATIEWNTDTPADSKVSYGLTTSYTDNVQDANGVRLHSIVLTNLQPSTTYHYAVGSADQDGHVVTTDPAVNALGVSHDWTFHTPATQDNAAPVFLEGPVVEFTNKIAIVRWTTDQLSTSRVVIGVVPASRDTFLTADIPVYGVESGAHAQLVVESNDLVTDHSVTVTGLLGGVGYLFRASSANAAGQQVSSFDPTLPHKLQPPGGFGSFTTSTQPDTQFPVITQGPTVVASTSSSLTVQWGTDESSNSVVDFGAPGDSLANSSVSGTNEITHRVVLTKLAAGATYAYQVASTDASGNGATVSQVAYGTTDSSVDLTAPVITTAPSVIYKNDRLATISWATNEPANSEVDYGTAQNNLDQVTSLPDFNQTHTVSLTNLQAGTTYYFQVASMDQSNNGPTRSAVLQFTTDAQPDVTPPRIQSLSVSAADSLATVTWTTDEVSDSAVKYGTANSGTLGLITGSGAYVLTHTVTLTNLTPATTYNFTIESSDRVGNGPADSSATFTTLKAGEVPALTAPAKPTVTAGNATVRLNWTAATASGVTGYVVERSVASGAFAPVATLGTTTSYVDGTVQNGTAYQYRLRALGAKQSTSDPSTATDAVTPEANKGPGAPAFFALEGNPLQPTIVIQNSPSFGGATLTYSFQLSTMADFSDAVSVSSGVAARAGLGTDTRDLTTWTVNSTLENGKTYYWRAQSSDGTFNSLYASGSFTVDASRPEYPGDLTGNAQVDFFDFVQFLKSYNKKAGDTGYNAAADLNGDGKVDFFDFVQFLKTYNMQYVKLPGAGKRIPQILTYGVDGQTQFNLVGKPTSSEKGSAFAVNVNVSGASDLKGYGLRISYDPSSLQFVSANAADGNILQQDGRVSDLFGTFSNDPTKGEITIGSAVTQGAPAEGQGTLATLHFLLRDNSPQGNLVYIEQGLIINGKFQVNAAQNLGGRLSLVPDHFALDFNYPNPFNPATTIRYAVPKEGKVVLRIYNILGQQIATLVNKSLLPGYYMAHWDGRDATGREVASGVYLYRMQAQGFSKVHKMLLLK